MTDVSTLIRQLRASDQRGVGRVEYLENGPDSIDRLLALESEATQIRAYDWRVVPGLLQTPAYSSGVIQATNPRLSEREVMRRTFLKNARVEALKDRLDAAPGLERATFVLGERAITQAIGGGNLGAHARQLEYLLKMSEHPRVVLLALPEHVIPAGLAFHFTEYTFGGESDRQRLGYQESVMGGWYSTRLEDTVRLQNAFADLVGAALGPHDTRQLIREVLRPWNANTKGLPS